MNTYVSLYSGRIITGMIIILSSFLLLGCVSVKRDMNDAFMHLIKEQLGIGKLLHPQNANENNIELVDGKQYRLNSGKNFLIDPLTGIQVEFFVEIRDLKIYKLKKTDTLINENKIIHEEWTFESRSGEHTFSTTDLKGNLIHFYGQSFLEGEHQSRYVETTVDSLGNAFTEWGIVDSKSQVKRKR